jgi:hypothetical protein
VTGAAPSGCFWSGSWGAAGRFREKSGIERLPFFFIMTSEFTGAGNMHVAPVDGDAAQGRAGTSSTNWLTTRRSHPTLFINQLVVDANQAGLRGR